MTCPQCSVTAEPVLTVQGVHVCAACGMTVIGDGPWRKAMYADIAGLTAAEVMQLKAASAPIARPKR